MPPKFRSLFDEVDEVEDEVEDEVDNGEEDEDGDEVGNGDEEDGDEVEDDDEDDEEEDEANEDDGEEDPTDLYVPDYTDVEVDETDDPSEEGGEEGGEEGNDKIRVPGLEDLLGVLVIGDTHFREKHLLAGQELIDRCVEEAESLAPTAIIAVGDILDTHGKTDVGAFNLAMQFIQRLSEIAPLYVMMGNHDLINNSQFLSTHHFFGPYRKWPDVTIVDKVVELVIGTDIRLVLCPYVAKGRLIEALDTCESDWRSATCIFAHTEIQGVKLQIADINSPSETVGHIKSHLTISPIDKKGVKETPSDVVKGKKTKSRSSKGYPVEGPSGDVAVDTWKKEYPPLISGHIHLAQKIGENVYYLGSSIQVAANEPPEKNLWYVSFDPKDPTKEGLGEREGLGEEEDATSSKYTLQIDEIPLCIRGYTTVDLTVEELETNGFDWQLLEKYRVYLRLSGDPDQFRLFRTSKMFTELETSDVKIKFVPCKTSKQLFEDLRTATRKTTSFSGVLKELVKRKDSLIQDAYTELYGLVFPLSPICSKPELDMQNPEGSERSPEGSERSPEGSERSPEGEEIQTKVIYKLVFNTGAPSLRPSSQKPLSKTSDPLSKNVIKKVRRVSRP